MVGCKLKMSKMVKFYNFSKRMVKMVTTKLKNRFKLRSSFTKIALSKNGENYFCQLYS